MQAKYHDKGLRILLFPCNQFGGQEPWPEAEIKQFVADKFGFKGDMFAKVDVKGETAHPVWKWCQASFPGAGDTSWNFATKYVIGRDGQPAARCDKASLEDIEKVIVEELGN